VAQREQAKAIVPKAKASTDAKKADAKKTDAKKSEPAATKEVTES
jgi:hypothetical protein